MTMHVQLPYSTVAGEKPTAADLEDGELAVNPTDQQLFVKDGSGNVLELLDFDAGLMP